MPLGQINRVHGQDAAGAFYGYTPLVVRITCSGGAANVFTADSVDGTTGAITIGGYTEARMVLQNFASIVWLGARDTGNDVFTAIVDQPTANQGDGTGGNAGATTGWGALKAALAVALGGAASDYAVATSATLNGVGTFTFA
jgi:hypothetical protein